MDKLDSLLSLSSSDSYQSINDKNIECCICNEIILNENSYMPNCKHSWCFECNEKLNVNKINNCPICKKKFRSILTNGRWKLKKNRIGGYYWKWEKGKNDSKMKFYRKKTIQILSNVLFVSSSINVPIGNLSV